MNPRRTLLLAGCSLGVLSAAAAAVAENRKNPVEGRFEKLRDFTVDKLPLQDAIRIVHGAGQRRIAVFSDPNCGHCKRVDRDLKAIGNVTVYIFPYPVLGDDSARKARDIWCGKDSAKRWEDWMQAGVAPTQAMGACDAAALQRNAALGRKLKINGTPALIFSDGTFVPGAIPAAWIETLLAAAERR